MPVFALANAGVSLGADAGAAFTHPVSLGIVAGLVLGKPIGILGFAWLAVRLGFADLPEGVRWRQICGASCLAGVGFTMSLFVAGLAFGAGSEQQAAKVGILAASLVAGAVGWLVLRTGPEVSDRRAG
jgi:NhaA family Na+:H+ antiporter